MQSMDTSHQQLLSEVGRLYERHGQSDRSKRRFNIFTTLRKSSDEVNLHSRFLHALLDHQDPTDDRRRNLEDFLTKVVGIKCFPVDGAIVHREFDNIDLLIENVQQKQAVVIENKIWSGDTARQLQRYHEKLLARDYPPQDISLLYLTPFGDSPSKQSVGDLDCETVSYVDLLPWLERCQKRAFDDPALRESIAQYTELVRKLTNTDRSAEYMNELKNLCLKDDNLIMAHELSQALVDAKSELVCNLGRAINDEIARIEGFLPSEDIGLCDYERVKACLVSKQSKYLGLAYPINQHAQFIVGAGNSPLWYGVSCKNEDCPEFYAHLKEILSAIPRGLYDSEDPWYRYVEINDAGQRVDIRELDREDLLLLNSKEHCRTLAKTISTELGILWNEIKKNGLI